MNPYIELQFQPFEGHMGLPWGRSMPHVGSLGEAGELSLHEYAAKQQPRLLRGLCARSEAEFCWSPPILFVA